MEKAGNDREKQELEGVVERVVYRNEENGWTVLDVSCGDEIQTVVGVIPLAAIGERLKLRGRYVEHATFGHQFQAEDCERQLPTEETAILRYLGSGAIKGIGPSTAIAIVRKFHEQSLKIIEEDPERLVEVRGISPARARKIADEFQAQFGLRDMILALGEYGLTPAEAMQCWKRFGSAAAETIRNNPYLLCVSGMRMDFERVDKLCLERDFAADDPRRVNAALLYVLRHNTGNGHTCLPADKLVPTTAALLGIPEPPLYEALARMTDTMDVRQEIFGDRPFVFLPALYDAEKHAAAKLTQMAARAETPVSAMQLSRLQALEEASGICYADEQRQAILEALEKGLLVLTGGPGTGKTTTLRAMLTLFEAAGETVLLAAPTGRAAKRMEELTGREAKTLHRLLEVQWDESDAPVFARHERNPLEADAVIVDELSMVDVLLFDSLLRALRPRCRLIMVGDADQLPAVGAGNVLGDLIASGAVPVVQLRRVFRQAMESEIVSNAHRIVAGERPKWSDRSGDFFLMSKTSAASVMDTVVDLCTRRLPERYGESVFDGIQVLCPGRRGELGTTEFNQRLQEALNPYAASKAEITVAGKRLRTGDKVMQGRNNYNIGWTRDDGSFGTGIFNGDVGVLTDINKREETLTVRFEDREVSYSRQDAEDLELAYAVTVHKSQGSEFDMVILPLFRQQRQLCYRHLLYTAVTRAKRLLIIVGSEQTVTEMVDNNKKTLRYSALRVFLQQMKESNL